MNKLLFLFLLILFLSCTLFQTSLMEYSDSIEISNMYIDSVIIDSAGYYQFEYYSDYNMDIIFFNTHEGMDLFINNDELYSEYVYYPLIFINTTYFLQDVFIYEPKTLYFIIDNSYNLTDPEEESNFTLKVFLKEE